MPAPAVSETLVFEFDVNGVLSLHDITVNGLAVAMGKHRVQVSRYLHGHNVAPESMFAAFGQLSGCGVAVEMLRQIVAANRVVARVRQIATSSRVGAPVSAAS
jgi:hypothetical protein